MKKQDIIQTALNSIVKVHKDILRAERIGDISFVILEDGHAGVAYKKKGDIDKPYKALELAYNRAIEEQIMEGM